MGILKSLHSLILLCFFVLWVPWSYFFPLEINLQEVLLPPQAKHFLGTDSLGRDLLSCLHEALIGVILPLWGITLLGSSLGFLVGALDIGKIYESKILLVLKKLANIGLTSISFIPQGITMFGIAFLSEEISFVGLSLSFFLLFFAQSFSQTHMLFQQSRYLHYWLAHESLGGNRFKRVVHYGFKTEWKNSIHNIMISQLKMVVIIEVSLSYLGFGVQEPRISLGSLLAQHYYLLFKNEPWITIMTSLVLGSILYAPHLFIKLIKEIDSVPGKIRTYSRSC